MTPKVKVTVGLETYYIRKDDEVALLEFLEHLEGSDHIEWGKKIQMGTP